MPTNIGWILPVLAVAGSYGWAVRGTTIGKEKGALLPGALLGIFLAWFTASPVIRENFWIYCAAGALGMAVGGTETYAQTMGFVLKPAKASESLKGNLGLAFKGLLWFGIFGAILGMAFTATAGIVYKAWELAAVFAAMPFLRALGIRVFNMPFDPKKGIFPKMYLSGNRFEEWGGMLMVLLELAVFLIVKGDRFALFLCGFSALGGAVGWVIAINMMRISIAKKKNGKYIFGSLQTKGMIDNWKIMEYTLGAVGALGAGAGFILGFPALRPTIDAIEGAGRLWSPLCDMGLEKPLTYIVIALILFCADLLVAWLGESKLKLKKGERMGDIAEQVLYTYIALPLVLLGAMDFARMLSVLVLYWVLMVEMVSNRDKLPSVKGNLKLRWPLALIGVFYLALEICSHFIEKVHITIFTPLFLYLVVYYFIQIFFYDLLPHRMKARRGAAKKEGTKLRPHHFGAMLTQEGFKLITMLFIWLAAWRLGMIG